MNHCLICGQRDCQVCAYTEDAPEAPRIRYREEPAEVRKPYVPSPEYAAWCAEIDLRRGIERDLRFTIEQQRKDAA